MGTRRDTTSEDDEARAAVEPLLRTRQYVEFTDASVDPRALDAIVDVARWSGSANNRQPWRFIVIRDRSTIARLADAGLPHTVTLTTAPAAIAISLPADPERLEVDAYDDGRAAERVLIAALMLGLGAAISWVRPDVLPAVRKILSLPAERIVRTIMAVGHPTTRARRPRSPRGQGRLPRGTTVLEERWRD